MRQDVFYHNPEMLQFMHRTLPAHTHHSVLMCLLQLIFCKQDTNTEETSTWFLNHDPTLAYLQQNLYNPQTTISNSALFSTGDSLKKTFECLQQLKFHLHSHNDLFFEGDVTTTPLYQHIYQNIQQCIEQSSNDNINNEEAFTRLAMTARKLVGEYPLTYRTFQFESQDDDGYEDGNDYYDLDDYMESEGHFVIETATRTSFWIRSLILLAQSKMQLQKKQFSSLQAMKLSQRQFHRSFCRSFLQNE